MDISKKTPTFAPQSLGEMAEWSIAAVLKTVEGNTSGGSNPSLSAKSNLRVALLLFTPVEDEVGKLQK